MADLVDLGDLAQPRDTDAMALCYLVPGEETFPRLNTGALPTLQAAGQEPLVSWVFLDVDNEGHQPWPDLGTAAIALLQAIEATGMGGYTTRAGFRLVAPLHPPLPASVANSWLQQYGDSLPLDVDPASYEWTRLMRLPRSKRDGQVLDSIVSLDGLTPIDPYSYGFTLEEQSCEAQDFGDAPLEPVTLTWEDWRHATDMPWASKGQPVPAGPDGSSYRYAKTCLARIAGRGNITDPHTLASYLWASTLATGNSSLSLASLWDLACWVADRQSASPPDPNHGTDGALPPGEPESSDWAILRGALKGKLSPYYGRLRDGTALTTRPGAYRDKLLDVLRTVVMATDKPADYYYRVFKLAATAQKAPLLPELWERCQALVQERTESLETDDRHLVQAFVMEHPLTITSPDAGTRLYQLDTTTTPFCYRPSSMDLIEHDLHRFTLPNLPFQVDYTGLAVRVILRDFGGRAENMVYVSGQDGCHFDAENSTLAIGCHQRRQVKPVYHKNVAEWLKLLGGDDPEGLLDWLACVTENGPMCSLYIQGPPACGKSLLGSGIASLWGTAPLDYNRTLNSDYNGELTTSPVLFADEGVKVDRRNQASAALQFRNVVSGTNHKVNAKFQAPVNLTGSLRVLICSNDENGLPFKESLGADGIEAIVQRVLYIKADPAAVDYLRGLGGRDGLEGWVNLDNSPGKVAEHITWLAHNRQVEAPEGGRFRVVGKPTKWHREFGARQGIKPSALQVVYGLLHKARAGGASSKGAVKNDKDLQVVWVKATAVLQAWDVMARSFRAKPADIRDSLHQLSVERRNIRIDGSQTKAYAIPWTAFIDAAVCELEDLEDLEEGT
jgi:hypothetical protein